MLQELLTDPMSQPTKGDLYAVAEMTFGAGASLLSRSDQKELFEHSRAYAITQQDRDETAHRCRMNLNAFIDSTKRRIDTYYHNTTRSECIHRQDVDGLVSDMNLLKKELALLSAKVNAIWNNLGKVTHAD